MLICTVAGGLGGALLFGWAGLPIFIWNPVSRTPLGLGLQGLGFEVGLQCFLVGEVS